MIYNVSAMMTANDNGVCFSFATREAADQCERELREQGAYHVRRWNA